MACKITLKEKKRYLEEKVKNKRARNLFFDL